MFSALEEKRLRKLSNRNPDDLRSGTRDLVIGDKEDALILPCGRKMKRREQAGAPHGVWVDLAGTLNVAL